MKMNSRGEVVGGAPGASTASIKLPEKPVPVGGTWTGTVPVGGMGGGSINAVYKFVGVKNIGGKQVAVINVTVNGMGKGTGVTHLAMADGSLVKSVTNLNITAGQGQSMKMIATVTRK
jgi:hypothetical protein